MPVEPSTTDDNLANPFWGADWPEVRDRWPLEATVAHLNHGSFGAVPRAVLAEQQSWRDRMEVNPVRFFRRELPSALATARGEVGEFLGADDGSLAFVPNATTGASSVLAAFPFEPGDHLLLTDHSYGAVRIAADRFAAARGAQVDIAAVPLAAQDDEVVATVLGALHPRTRLVIVDHVTAPTARRFPVEILVPALHERGAAVLVDGAHAPGMLDLALDRLGADFYLGNLHKWVCAPRGTAILHAAAAWRAHLRPLVGSWGEPEGFPMSFDETGTEDATAWLSAPKAVRELCHLDLDRLRTHNAQLARWGQELVGSAIGLDPGELPHVPEMSMQLIPLPRGIADSPAAAIELARRLGEESAVEVAIGCWNGQGLLRVSAQAYNGPGDYRRLAAELPALL